MDCIDVLEFPNSKILPLTDLRTNWAAGWVMNKRRNLAHDNLILCGIGKSWLASALGHKACRDNRSVLYQRIPKLFADLALGRRHGLTPQQLFGWRRHTRLAEDEDKALHLRP
jgi:IstB-like ATP binding protein